MSAVDLMKLDYADRQFVVVRPDEVVLKARQPVAPPDDSSARDNSDNDKETERAVLSLAAPIGDALRSIATRWSQRRSDGRGPDVLSITRSEARQLSLPMGHPREDVVYVGNPALPGSYYTLAEFHRETFSHKYAEALALVAALGAQSMSVAAVQGWSREFAASLTVPFRGFNGDGRGGTRSSSSRELFYAAELKGSGDPRLPPDLRWFPHEPEWQSFARQRIEHDLREFTLHVRYEEDFAVTVDVASKFSGMDLSAGGTFERHQSTVWSIAATFPPNQSRALRAMKHPFG